MPDNPVLIASFGLIIVLQVWMCIRLEVIHGSLRRRIRISSNNALRAAINDLSRTLEDVPKYRDFNELVGRLARIERQTTGVEKTISTVYRDNRASATFAIFLTTVGSPLLTELVSSLRDDGSLLFAIGFSACIGIAIAVLYWLLVSWD